MAEGNAGATSPPLRFVIDQRTILRSKLQESRVVLVVLVGQDDLLIHLPIPTDHQVSDCRRSLFVDNLLWSEVKFKVVRLEEMTVHTNATDLQRAEVGGDRPILPDELDRGRGLNLIAVTVERMWVGAKQPTVSTLPVVTADVSHVDISEAPLRNEVFSGLDPSHFTILSSPVAWGYP